MVEVLKFLMKKILLGIGGIAVLGIGFTGSAQAYGGSLALGGVDDQLIEPVTLTGTSGDREVDLEWIDSNDSMALTGYRIIYGQDHDLSFYPAEFQVSLDLGVVSSKKIEGLENGAEYFFRIARLEGESISGESVVISLTPIDNVAPITALNINPTLPEGLAGFYTTAPLIEFVPSEAAITYYQWNSTEELSWQEASGSLAVSEGENILYYYSVDLSGNVEQIRWQIFKVDTIAPGSVGLGLNVGHEQRNITLIWSQSQGAAIYEIWQITPIRLLVARVPAEQLSYVLNGLEQEVLYQFQIVAFDEAGNFAYSNIAEGKISWPGALVILPVVSTPAPESAIKPAIGEGISTVAQNTENVENVVPKALEGEKTEENGWNKLLIALSILVIAAGIAAGGYYGYEWYSKKDSGTPDSRW